MIPIFTANKIIWPVPTWITKSYEPLLCTQSNIYSDFNPLNLLEKIDEKSYDDLYPLVVENKILRWEKNIWYDLLSLIEINGVKNFLNKNNNFLNKIEKKKYYLYSRKNRELIDEYMISNEKLLHYELIKEFN